MQEVDDEFYKRADAHIQLSNEQITEKIGRGKVSASFMFSVARFNSYITATRWNSRDELIAAKEDVMGYFVSEYRKMLEENLDDHIENFDEYMGIKD